MTIGTKERLLDFTGSFVDRIFLTAPRILNPFKARRTISHEEYESQIDFYFTKGYVDDPASFFTFPSKAPPYTITKRKPYHDGEYQTIAYESGYTAKNPLIRERYHSFEANGTGYLIRWTHGDRGRKTVLCHHGFMLGEPQQAQAMFKVDTLFNSGLDVALFIAPFHWKRGTGTLRQRGIYLQPDDVVMTCECFGQAMHDLYSTFLILSDLGSTATGLIGASLGGYNTALFTGLTDIHAFAAMIVPAVNFSRPLGPDTARHTFALDETLHRKIKQVWELHSPLQLLPRLPEDRILVVASRGDLVCPFVYVKELCDTWRITRRHFLTGGHWLVFNRNERGRAWYNFLLEMGFNDSRS